MRDRDTARRRAPPKAARERLRHLPWYNSLVVRAVGSDLLTVRIDLSS